MSSPAVASRSSGFRRNSDSDAASPNFGSRRPPPFLLPDEQGRLVGLEDLLAEGPVAIAFHRGHWCPYCRINISALAQAEGEIASDHRHIVAIVPDRQKFTIWLKADAKVPFPILTDMDNGYAMSLNLTIWIGSEMEQLLRSFGRTLPDYQANDAWLLPIPATFVVGTDPLGVIVLLGVPALLAAGTMAACWIPAVRAAKVDPTLALRQE